MSIILNPYVMAPAGGGATTLIEDTFTDTDATNLSAHTPDTDSVGGGWSADRGSISITSNVAKATSATDHIYSIQTNETDITVEMDVRYPTVGAAYGGPALRVSDANNLIFCQEDSGSFKIYKREGGSYSALATLYIGVSTAWRTMKIKATGNLIEAWLDGSNYISATTTFNNTATKAGIRADRPAEFDNMVVTT